VSGILDFLDGSTWVIPDGWTFVAQERPSHCRSCDAPVIWLVSEKSGSRSPFNPSGTSHFSDCPDARTWRRKR
jgi:hypothetical protein